MFDRCSAVLPFANATLNYSNFTQVADEQSSTVTVTFPKETCPCSLPGSKYCTRYDFADPTVDYILYIYVDSDSALRSPIAFFTVDEANQSKTQIQNSLKDLGSYGSDPLSGFKMAARQTQNKQVNLASTVTVTATTKAPVSN